MALYNKGQQGSSNAIFLSPKTRDAENKDIDACFKGRKKNEDGGYEDIEDDIQKVEGNIRSLTIKHTPYNDEVISAAQIIMDDPGSDETYIVGLKFNMLNRSIMNCILSIKALENVSISLYRNKKGYNSAWVEQGGAAPGWKFAYADLPRPIEITHPKLVDPTTGRPKVISRDYSELDDFFISELESWAANLDILGPAKKEDSVKPNESSAKKEGDDDSAPFVEDKKGNNDDFWEE